jgi:hypothetical protein
VAKRGSISLIVKGPIKSAKRAGARHGVHLESCATTGSGKSGDVQCYAPCHPGTDTAVNKWFIADHSLSSRGKRAKPGALLYHGRFCGTDSVSSRSTRHGLSGRKRRKRK